MFSLKEFLWSRCLFTTTETPTKTAKKYCVLLCIALPHFPHLQNKYLLVGLRVQRHTESLMCVLAKVLQGTQNPWGMERWKGGRWTWGDRWREGRKAREEWSRVVCWQILHLAELIHCCILIFNWSDKVHSHYEKNLLCFLKSGIERDTQNQAPGRLRRPNLRSIWVTQQDHVSKQTRWGWKDGSLVRVLTALSDT